jgi:hypothetical protein
MKKIFAIFMLAPIALFASGGRNDNNAGAGRGAGKCDTNPACNKVSNFSPPSDGNQNANAGTVIVVAAAGIAVVGALWWLLGAKPSANFDGHARLTAF